MEGMNEKFREYVHKLATESGMTDMEAAERFAVTLGQRWMGINTPFICGGTEDKDAWGLPSRITVCPSYGSDGFAVYVKSTEYSAPGY
jgi:hypothetical protein